jgi:choline dehydrogenase
MAQPAMGAMASSLFAPEDTCQSDSDWEEFARQNATYGAHPVGTCRMGGGEDAVVGNDLRVNGVSGLRVVDASVMPTSPSGNTNAPTMMIAERAADLVMNGK